MWTVLITRRHVAAVVAALVTLVACAGPDRSTGVATDHVAGPEAALNANNPNSAAGDEQGFISGYLDGETMALRYTRLYFCAEPPESAAPSGCEVGAGPTIAPRSGPIPKIYALAPAGFVPDPSTVHCKGGTVCLNHPTDAGSVAARVAVERVCAGAQPRHRESAGRVARYGECPGADARGMERDRRGEEPNEGAGAAKRRSCGARHPDERLLLLRGAAAEAGVRPPRRTRRSRRDLALSTSQPLCLERIVAGNKEIDLDRAGEMHCVERLA